jgi:hypothetical protein
MSTWSEASALCDLAIEAIARRKGLRGAAREKAWKTPQKILKALGALLEEALPEGERLEAERLEFEAIEGSGGSGKMWPVSGDAWRAGLAVLGPSKTAAMGLARLGAAARAASGLGKGSDSDFRKPRQDVGGKILRVMREGSLSWLGETGGLGEVGPTGRELSNWALELHGRWCSQVGVLAEWDWESGIHAYGFGIWLDEMEKGSGGRFERWGQELLDASAQAVERFGRLPRLPKDGGMNAPAWTYLVRYAGHEDGSGVHAHSWAWGSRFPMLGSTSRDSQWCEEEGWPAKALSDPLRGRSSIVSAMLSSEGLGHLRTDFERLQGVWAARHEAHQMRQEGVAQGSLNVEDGPAMKAVQEAAEPLKKSRNRSL